MGRLGTVEESVWGPHYNSRVGAYNFLGPIFEWVGGPRLLLLAGPIVSLGMLKKEYEPVDPVEPAEPAADLCMH